MESLSTEILSIDYDGKYEFLVVFPLIHKKLCSTKIKGLKFLIFLVYMLRALLAVESFQKTFWVN